MNTDLKLQNDTLLVKKMIEGDYKSCLSLAKKYQDSLIRFMYFWTGERLFAQTIVLNSFEILFKNRSKMNPYQPFFPEVLKYAIQLSEAAPESIRQSTITNISSVPLNLSDNSKNLLSAIRSLETNFKKVLILAKLLNVSNDLLAEYLNLPSTDTEKLLSEAEKELLRKLG